MKPSSRFLWIAAAIAGCSGGSVQHGGQDAGVGVDAGDAGGPAAGGTNDGGGDGGPGAQATFEGDIEAVSLIAPGTDGGAPARSFSVTAFFNPDVGAGGSGCADGIGVGSCCYLPPSGGGGSAPVSAGTLTLLDDAAAVASMPFDPTNGYGTLTSVSWDGGDSLTVRAAGDVVAPFEVETHAPVDFTGLSPSLSGGVTLPTGSSWTLSWAPGGADSVEITIGAAPGVSVPDGGTPVGSITCTPDDDAGTVTIDSTLLANFTSGQAGQISVARVNAGGATPANGTVVFRASTMVTANATFQ